MVSTIAATRAMTITADTVFFCFGLIISTYLPGSVALDGFDGIDDRTSEAVLLEGSDAADRCTAR